MLKCSKEAFTACPDRKGCGCFEQATFVEGSECDKFNREIGIHVMTHADRIRAMSDEELADAIVKMACGIDPAESFCQSKKECEDLMDADKEIPEEWCRQCVLAMLQQPAEVSDGGN